MEQAGRRRAAGWGLLLVLLLISGWWLADRNTKDGAPDLRPARGGVDDEPVLQGRAVSSPAPELDAALREAASAERETAPGWRVRGRVLAAMGRPLPHTRVQLSLQRGSPPMTVTEVVTITDDEGLYEGVVPLRAGRGRTYDRTTLLEVQAAAPGHRETARLVTGIPSSLETLLPDLTLRPGCVVRGRVLRADGEAAPDVEVFLIHDRRNDVFAEAVTDEGGRYVLDTGPHDVSTTYWLAAVSCAQGQGTGERFELWRAGEYEFGDLKLEAPLVIEGTVTYADGEPVGRADVGATALDDDDPATLRNPWTGVEVWEHCDPYVQTDAQGRFRLVVHSPGDWCVSTTSFPEVVERVVPAGRMDLRFQIHAHALDVTVVDEHDDPLPGAWVVLQCWEPLYAEEAASLLDAGVPRTGSAYPPSRRDVRVTGRDGMTRKFVASGSLCAIGVLLDMEVVREPPTWQVVRVDPDRNESAVEIRTSTE